MPCHVHYTCHTTRTNPYHTTPMPSFMPSGVLCVTAGCHSTFPSAKPGERASKDIRVIVTNQAIPCPFLLRLVLTLSFAFPSPPPSAPLCLPRTYAKKLQRAREAQPSYHRGKKQGQKRQPFVFSRGHSGAWHLRLCRMFGAPRARVRQMLHFQALERGKGLRAEKRARPARIP